MGLFFLALDLFAVGLAGTASEPFFYLPVISLSYIACALSQFRSALHVEGHNKVQVWNWTELNWFSGSARNNIASWLADFFLSSHL